MGYFFTRTSHLESIRKEMGIINIKEADTNGAIHFSEEVNAWHQSSSINMNDYRNSYIGAFCQRRYGGEV